MTDLERTLRTIDVEWPETPDVAARLEFRPRPRRGRALAIALAVVVAVGVAFAVPQSRGAILRFLHLGGVTVERVGTLPQVPNRSLVEGLGGPVGTPEARRILGTAFLPVRHGPLYARDGFVSTLVGGRPLLLTEFGSAGLIKKIVATSKVKPVDIAPGIAGLWIAGAPHAVFFPGTSPRLAGNVLVWTSGNVTFRLEGRGLDRDEAVRTARDILGTPDG
jgi:hypothetical protein